MAVMTGLSGNEMYCLNQTGLRAGDLIIGNSVFSLGFIGGLGSGIRTLAGGEVTQVTEVIQDGRRRALHRLVQESERRGAAGITGVNSELMQFGTNIEFLSVGSAVHQGNAPSEQLLFTSSADGQELFCQLDAGFHPIKFVFGNVAYSIGVGGGIGGAFRGMKRGEVPQYSQVFNETRHRALERITAEAKAAGANAVVGIKTTILPFRGMQEMMMIGTASRHPALPATFDQAPVTSELTNIELWNVVRMGYLPVQLVLGVSVYSLGLVGSVTSAFKKLGRGEIAELTTLIYDARENALDRIRKDAAACGADDVAGIRTYVYEIGSGLIEFMAIGTAVKKVEGVSTRSDQLPPQAVMEDKTTFVNTAELTFGANLNQRTSPGSRKAAQKAEKLEIRTAWDVVKLILRILEIFLR